MRPILKRLDVGASERREIVQDEWKYVGEEGAPVSTGTTVTAAGAALIVPFAELSNYRRYAGRLGVRLSPADAVEDLGEDVKRLSLVAVTFPSAGEGRGFTQGRLLRSARFGFKGELRAVGAGVKQDLLFIMARCGFDAFELAPGQKIEEALRALDRYSVAYAPAEPVPSVKLQRLHAAG
ncbi:MAG: DUF934 domain-containing protein [Proteobacteria bacterium]|nr:DUF934 domain-containing protein [Pseudomonadota bacterium]